MKKFITGILLLFLFFTLSINSANAQTILFEDNFSNGFEKWQSVRSQNLWTIVDEKAESYVENGMTITELVPKDEYWNQSWENYEYELDFTGLEGVDKNVSFGYQDLNNWYEIHFYTEQGHYEVVKVDNKQAIWRSRGIYLLENNQSYKVKIRFNEGNITIFINETEILNANDWTFNNDYGKIGIKAGTGSVYPTKVQFDNIVVRSIEETPPPNNDNKLDVTLFKQNDDQWKSQEYDHASQWSSKTTIQNWGCALSSMAMVFDYHGINKMPDGNNINPSTLNNWLKSQPDGYIGDGIINWIAGTRLTRILNEQFGSTKLEYSRASGDSIDTTKSEVDAGSPSILQIDGHFLVGTGYTDDGSDLFINDPAYNYDKFSQHNTSLLSTRKFQPSNTDLSYFVLSGNENTYAVISRQDGISIIDKRQFFSEKIKNDDGSGEETEMKLLTISKPESGIYDLAIIRPEFGKYDLQFFAYDKEANPSTLHQAGYVGRYPHFFQVDYNKDGESTIKQIVDWNRFKFDLTQMKTDGHLKSNYAYMRLMRLVQYAQNADASKQARYANLIGRYLSIYGRYMTTEGKAYLSQQFEALKAGL